MFKKTLLAAALAAGGLGAANAFMPQNGLWAVPAEVNGEPGRGFIVDVENNTMFLTVFTYDSDGRPTFYTSGGTVQPSETNPGEHVYTGTLQYSQNGPGLAATGDVSSGTIDPARSPGDVTLRFTGTGTGFIRFPGGSADLPVARFNYGYTEAKADNLLGAWSYGHPHGNHSHVWAAELLQKAPATTTGSGVAQRSNGLYGCEYQTSGAYANRLLCVIIGGETDGARNVDVLNLLPGANETDGVHRRIRGWKTGTANADADVNPEPEVNQGAFARRTQGIDSLPEYAENVSTERSFVHEVIDWVVARPDFFKPEPPAAN